MPSFHRPARRYSAPVSSAVAGKAFIVARSGSCVGGAASEQPLLGHQAHIQRVGHAARGGEHLQGILGASQVAQEGGLESQGTNIPGVGLERALHEVGGSREIAAAGRDFGGFVIGGGAPRQAPGGLVEGLVGLVGLALGFERQAEVVSRLGIFRRGVFIGEAIEGLAEELLGVGEAGLALSA